MTTNPGTVWRGVSDAQLDEDSISCATETELPTGGELQRAAGSVRLALRGSERGTRILDVYERSPIRVLFPGTRRGAIEEVVLVNTAGGIVGGDRLEYLVTALTDACAIVTSQAAERVYRALKEPARVSTRLQLDSRSRLAWLPQETILFDGARLQRSTQIDVASGSELLALEWFLLGREAYGERVSTGAVCDNWRVRIDGRLAWADSLCLTEDVFPELRCRALLGDFRAVGLLVYFGPAVEERLQFLRERKPSPRCQCLGTTVAGLLICRLAARQPLDLKTQLRELLNEFDGLRESWVRLPKMWSY